MIPKYYNLSTGTNERVFNTVYYCKGCEKQFDGQAWCKKCERVTSEKKIDISESNLQLL